MSPKTLSHLIEEILTFWFGAPDDADYGKPQMKWFEKNDDFDAQIKQRFEQVMIDARQGKLDDMAESPEGAVALLIALDQFPRNVYRGSAQAFAADAHARRIAQQVLARDFDEQVAPVMRSFIYLPFEHSEDLADQERSLDLFTKLGGNGVEWAQKHHVIIERFGRFPHRNEVLGRDSTPEETEFLTQPNSSF
ncbi:DUF924 family protein [Magnetovibrio sp. PR-2]|uniref:DUF924 family protein n=1 Tax=Magnetovibrio sp. PR-2 TaxID=3120356 RepID=UPI002FCE64F6